MKDTSTAAVRSTQTRAPLHARRSAGSEAEWELLYAGSLLAPWASRQSELALPADRNFGVVPYLQQALQNANAPHGSTLLKMDTLILITYGTSYLSAFDRGQDAWERLDAHNAQRNDGRSGVMERAEKIRRRWRTQRFPTFSLPMLGLGKEDYLLPDVQAKMVLGHTKKRESAMATVPIDDDKLREQVAQYSHELHLRVEARYHRAEEEQQHHEREQRNIEARKKKLNIQKKRRSANACRRWIYFTTKVLDRHLNADARLGIRESDTGSAGYENRHRRSSLLNRTGSSKQQAVLRAVSRHTVAKIIARAVSRVLCNADMNMEGYATRHADRSKLPLGSLSSPARATGTKTLRIGLLLCDIHFGEKYAGLYLRLMDRAAAAKGVTIQWEIFNCVKSEYPPQAYQRIADGFLVAGGPSAGHPTRVQGAGNNADESNTTLVPWRQRREFGWRRSLVKLLRQLCLARLPLGGLGLGHVLLAEALGGTCSFTGWEDGWNVLPAQLLTQLSARTLSQASPEKLGIKYLHGEYVEKMPRHGSDRMVWRSSDGHHVAGFREDRVLSLDGFPECGAFIFEAMSEFYDRDEGPGGLGETSIPSSLEHKKRAMRVKDAANTVADLLVDHFRRADVQHKLEVSDFSLFASVADEDLAASISAKSNQNGVIGISMTLRTTADGYLALLSQQFIDSAGLLVPRAMTPRRSSFSSDMKMIPAPLPTLQELRAQYTILSQLPNFGSRRFSRRDSLNGASLRRQMENAISSADHQGSSNAIKCMPPQTEHGKTPRHPASFQITGAAAAGSSRSLLRLPSQRERKGKAGVLTFAQVLLCCGECGHHHQQQEDQQNTRNVSVAVDFASQDEPFRHANEGELLSLWIRLLAAFRLSDHPDSRVVLICRQLSSLIFFRQRHPTWTLVKDCRGLSSKPAPAKLLLMRLGFYARFADAILVHHELLLGCSARESDAIFQQARLVGLQIFVSWIPEDGYASDSPRRKSITSMKSLATQRRRSSIRLIAPLLDTSEADSTKTHVIECMLLLLAGVHGIVTPMPDLVLEAKQAIADRSELVVEVQETFAKWQSAENIINGSGSRRSSLNRLGMNGSTLALEQVDDENDEDFLGDISCHNDDYDTVETNVLAEMAKQRSECGGADGPGSARASQALAPVRPAPPKREESRLTSGHRESPRRPQSVVLAKSSDSSSSQRFTIGCLAARASERRWIQADSGSIGESSVVAKSNNAENVVRPAEPVCHRVQFGRRGSFFKAKAP